MSKTSFVSIFAFIFSIIGFFTWWYSIYTQIIFVGGSIALGLLGIHDCNKNDKLTGKGLAIAALIISGLLIIGLVVLRVIVRDFVSSVFG